MEEDELEAARVRAAAEKRDHGKKKRVVARALFRERSNLIGSRTKERLEIVVGCGRRGSCYKHAGGGCVYHGYY
jgi:hypothetical protein